MNTNKRVEHQNCSDKELIVLFRQSRDRDALVKLYERYRVSIGNYLYRDIKNKETVADTFNTMMLDLVMDSSSQACGRKVSIKLFAMAHARRREYIATETQERTVQAAPTSTQENFKLESRLASLPRLHRDVIELVYKHNFTFDEAAEIIGSTVSVVSNCLSHIRNQHLPLLSGSNKSIEDYSTHSQAR